MSFTIRESGFLLARIEEQLADNNAGLISAADVRNNIGDAVRSTNAIVASGDTEFTFPFYQNVKAKHTIPISGPAYGGVFIAESGVYFTNAPDVTKLQTRPWLGVSNIQHNDLAGLTTADPHLQYVSISGHRPMQGNLRMASYWIGASGTDDHGFKFQYHPTGTTILTSGTMQFPDNSKLGSAIGVAKAFASFNGTLPSINYSYNVHSITKKEGLSKFEIELSSGVVGSGYTVIATSNARNTNSSLEDFDRNTTCSVVRSGINPSNGRVLFTLGVLNENGSFPNNSSVIDFVVFGSGL